MGVVIRLAGDSAPEAGVMALTLAVGAVAGTEWFALMDQCFHALHPTRHWFRAAAMLMVSDRTIRNWLEDKDLAVDFR
jgi:hypothetical protein